MIKKNFILMICLSILFLFPGLSNAKEAQANSKKNKFGIKLSGGINYLSAGDANGDVKGFNEYFNDLPSEWNTTMEGNFKETHSGMEFAGEVIFYFNSRFGISLGSGYIYAQEGKDTNMIIITFPHVTQTHTHDLKVSAIPVRVGVHYYLPLSFKTRFVFNGGMSYYFAKWSAGYRLQENGFWSARHQEATGTGLGFQGGAGFEIDISRNFAFVIEGYGRYAKIGDFKGDWTGSDSTGWSDSVEGTLYTYEWPALDNWYPGTGVCEVPPSELGWLNGKEAKVDFSGFMLRIGIRIRF